MRSYEYLIIGGGIAGVTAAETIRARAHTSTVAIVSSEPHVIYSRVLLPAFLKKQTSRDQLFLRTLDNFTEKRIDCYLGKEAVAVDVARREVSLLDGETIAFEKLLISAGGRPSRQAWIGEESSEVAAATQQYDEALQRAIEPFVYRLHTLDDADRFNRALPTLHHPVVIGSSFIAFEFLEIFTARALKPTIVSRSGNFFSGALDEAGIKFFREHLDRFGVTILQDQVISVEPKGERCDLITKNGARLQAGAIAVGIGLERNVEFLRSSGITIEKNGVKVNERLETNIEGIYAAGDIAQYYDLISRTYQSNGNWTNAVVQGKIAGQNMTGMNTVFKRVATYSIMNHGLHITVLGDICSEGEAITRSDFGATQYERFFIKDDALTGAFLVNRPGDIAYVTKLIETKTPITPYREKLYDIAFDIHQIPVIE